jgi:hypothetical protein
MLRVCCMIRWLPPLMCSISEHVLPPISLVYDCKKHIQTLYTTTIQRILGITNEAPPVYATSVANITLAMRAQSAQRSLYLAQTYHTTD